METVQTLNGQQKKIGHTVIRWYLTTAQTFIVTISKSIGLLEKEIKGWEFEASSISEAVSFCWYDYAIRSIEQEYVMGQRKVPEFLLNSSSSDAEEMIQMVLERLA